MNAHSGMDKKKLEEILKKLKISDNCDGCLDDLKNINIDLRKVFKPRDTR